jgi:hypothetical protein
MKGEEMVLERHASSMLNILRERRASLRKHPYSKGMFKVPGT